MKIVDAFRRISAWTPEQRSALIKHDCQWKHWGQQLDLWPTTALAMVSLVDAINSARTNGDLRRAIASYVDQSEAGAFSWEMLHAECQVLDKYCGCDPRIRN